MLTWVWSIFLLHLLFKLEVVVTELPNAILPTVGEPEIGAQQSPGTECSPEWGCDEL